MDCGTSMAKYILFIFNTLVSIIGILGIISGVLTLQNLSGIRIESDSLPPQAVVPIVLIVLSSVVVFIAFLGCCGAIRESVCMTMTYATFMLILLLIQLTIVVLLFVNKEKFQDIMGEVIDKAWDQESKNTGVFEAIQKSLHCCGKNSIADYALIFKKPPPSCCAEDNCLNPMNIYPGCRGRFMEVMSGSTETAKFAGLVLIGVELVAFIFACCLANNVRNYKRRGEY